ncbi:hypothetical protein P8452_31379 [Trifolium repens]|nr:hypothetical protein P8452_31379 [Trifolium repens]
MSKPPNAPPPRRLYKHVSWSLDMLREEVWHRKKTQPPQPSSSSSSIVSDNDDANITVIFNPTDDLATKKIRLKQWAKMVACVAQQSSQTSASGHSDQVD